MADQWRTRNCVDILRMRRQLSRLEATLDRQIELARRSAAAELTAARSQAAELAAEVARLRGLAAP